MIGGRACGLYHKNVAAAHVILYLNKGFAIRELGYVRAPQINPNVLADCLGKWLI